MLQQLPCNVLEIIVGHLSAPDQRSLALTCASLCAAIRLDREPLIGMVLQTWKGLARDAASAGRVDALDWAQHHCVRQSEAELALLATSANHPHVVQHLLAAASLADRDHPRWTDVSLLAALKGHFDTLLQILDAGCPISNEAWPYAASSDDLEIGQWVRTAWPPDDENNRPMWIEASRLAAQSGRLSTLRRMVDDGCPISDEAWLYAASSDDLEIGQWVRTAWPPDDENNRPMWIEASRLTAQSGRFNSLRRMVDDGCPISDEAWPYAASSDDLEIGQWVRTAWPPDDENNRPMWIEASRLAAQSGRLSTLRRMVDDGCPISDEAWLCAASSDDLEIIQWVLTARPPNDDNNRPMWLEASRFAAERGRLSTLRRMVDDGCPISDEAWLYTACSNDLEIIQWVLTARPPNDDNNRPMWFEASRLAAESGRFNMLRRMMDDGCPISDEAWSHAASRGDIESLQWVLTARPPNEDNNRPMWFEASRLAAESGRLNTLRRLMDTGCPISDEAWSHAASSSLDLFEWVLEARPPTEDNQSMWNEASRLAALNKRIVLLRKMVRAGCPISMTVQEDANRTAHEKVRLSSSMRSLGSERLGIINEQEKMAAAAGSGDLDLLQWVLWVRPPNKDSKSMWTEACSRAAKRGRLNVLRQMAEEGCLLCDDAWANIASSNSLLVFQWVLEARPPSDDNNRPMWTEASRLVAQSKRFDTLLRMVDAGCPISDEAWAHAASSENRDLLERVLEARPPSENNNRPMWTEASRLVAQTKRFNALRRMVNAGCPISDEAWAHAASNSDLDVFEWVLTSQPLGEETRLMWTEAGRLAAHGGQHDAFRWMVAVGCSISEEAWSFVAGCGNLEILEWVQNVRPPTEDNRPMWTEASRLAIEGSRLDVLRKMSLEGCPISEEGWEDAARRGELQMFQWLFSTTGQRPMWLSEPSILAAQRGDLDVLHEIVGNGRGIHVMAGVCAAYEGQLKVLKWLEGQPGVLWLPQVFRNQAVRLGHPHVLGWFEDRQ